MQIQISMLSNTPIYKQIKRQIKEAILRGIIPPGTQLPSVRLLAKDLSVGMVTVRRAYEELQKENIVVIMQGKGCFVNLIDREFIKKTNMDILQERLLDIKEFTDTAGINLGDLQNIIKRVWGDGNE